MHRTRGVTGLIIRMAIEDELPTEGIQQDLAIQTSIIIHMYHRQA
jgi:hypothetical protein